MRTVDSSVIRSEGPTQSNRNYDPFSTNVQRVPPSSHVGPSLIGQQIAREIVLRRCDDNNYANAPSPSGIDAPDVTIPTTSNPEVCSV